MAAGVPGHGGPRAALLRQGMDQCSNSLARLAYVAGLAFCAGEGGANQFRLCYSRPGPGPGNTPLARVLAEELER